MYPGPLASLCSPYGMSDDNTMSGKCKSYLSLSSTSYLPLSVSLVVRKLRLTGGVLARDSGGSSTPPRLLRVTFFFGVDGEPKVYET